MAIPASREDHKDYCLRALGQPVIEINVDEDQLDDRIDESLQFYQEYHSDAVIRNLRKHVITQGDIDNGYIDVPDSSGMFTINNVFSISTSLMDEGVFSVEYQMHLSDIFNLRGTGYGGGIANYEITQQYLSLINRNVSGVFELIEFSRHMNRVIFHAEILDNLNVGQYVIFDGYTAIDPDTYTDVWNDMFLKRYTTALFKRQWGLNLIKFEGVQLPGGVTFNGRQIFDDANQEILKIEEEMQLRFEEPPHFFVG